MGVGLHRLNDLYRIIFWTARLSARFWKARVAKGGASGMRCGPDDRFWVVVAEAVQSVVCGTVRHVSSPACYDPWSGTSSPTRPSWTSP